jgi:hypothetical protein
MRESAADVIACVSASIALFSASLIPWLLLVEAEHLTPRCVRELPAAARETARNAALSGLALLLICTPTQGATS